MNTNTHKQKNHKKTRKNAKRKYKRSRRTLNSFKKRNKTSGGANTAVKIEFLSPLIRLDGRERKSKLLNPDSQFHDILSNYRSLLVEKYNNTVSPQRMDFHIELIGKNETWNEPILLSRTAELEGTSINLNAEQNWFVDSKSVQILTGNVSGHGPTHVTVAFFNKGVPDEIKLNIGNFIETLKD